MSDRNEEYQDYTPDSPYDGEEEEKVWKPRPIPEGSRRLTKTDVAAINDTEELEIYVPGWVTVDGAPGTLLVRGLDRLAFHRARQAAILPRSKGMQVDLEKMEAHLMSQGIVEPKYTAAEIGVLMKKRMGAVQEVLDAINHLSGSTAKDRREAANAFRDR